MILFCTSLLFSPLILCGWEVIECTVEFARNNFRMCPVAGCQIDPAMERACEGNIITVDEVNENSDECCLKLCNFRCDSDPEDALQAGETCCDWEGNMSLVACEQTCASGLTCLYEEGTGATCKRNDFEPGKAWSYRNRAKKKRDKRSLILISMQSAS